MNKKKDVNFLGELTDINVQIVLSEVFFIVKHLFDVPNILSKFTTRTTMGHHMVYLCL